MSTICSAINYIQIDEKYLAKLQKYKKRMS